WLCRISTGSGQVNRKLYSDGDEVFFEAKNPVILNGIEDVIWREDLLDRSVRITCNVIPEEQRRMESEFFEELDTHLPYIFGGLLSLLSESLKNRNSVRPTLKKLPRMADFAVVATAALGQDFYDAYQRNQESSTELALESSPIASAIKKLMTNREKWEGTPT